MVEQPAILLIEDEPRLRGNMQILLQDEGYQVLTARNGLEGIKKLQDQPFDLVLTDVVMPEVDGFQVMEYVAEHFPDMVVVAITGYVSTESAVEAMRRGAYDYLTKPFDYDILKITIERALEKSRLRKALRYYTNELEQKVEERTRELTEANEKLENSLAELKATQEHLIQTEKLSALGELIASVAHELSSPLTTIVGYAELLTTTASVDAKIRDPLERISQEAFRCHQIVKGLLSFARKQKPQKAYVDVNALCDGILKLLAYQLKVGNISVQRCFDEKLPKTMADPHQLQQVFINLVTNGYQAMSNYRGAGTLVVETQQKADVIQIKFHDDGPGIPKEHQRKIFEPFFTTKESGTGLGLSISYGIIKEHGGEISVQSTPEEGTVFAIELPIIEQFHHADTPSLMTTSKTEATSRKRVLVVDDEDANLSLLLEVLGHLGHDVEGVHSGQEALEKIAKDDYDLLITDMKMPNVDGQRLYQQVKTLRPELVQRIIFTSGDALNEDTRAFLEQVSCPFVMKPFRLAEVEAIVGHACKSYE